MIQCPRDREILASNDVNGYRYYSCERCGGYWIPGAALHRVLSAQGAGELGVAPRSDTSEIQCPDCHADSDSFVIEGCRLDRCRTCHGVWLDSGDVQRVRRLFPDGSAVVMAAESRLPKETAQSVLAWSAVDAVGDLLLSVLPW